MDEKIRKMLKNGVNITHDDLVRLENNSPGVIKFMERVDDILKYRIVAEVTDSKYCFAQLKPGQRFVIDDGGVLNPGASTAPFCMRALGPLTGFVNSIIEMIAEGADPNNLVFRNAECLDPGLDHGGLGKVYFKIYVEKMRD